MPLAARLALVVAVACLAGVVLATVNGALPRVVGTVGAAFGGITDTVFATPSPELTSAPIPAAPVLVAPETAATNSPAVTVVGTVPVEVAGRRDHLVRIYVAAEGGDPVPFRDVPVGETPSFVVEGVPLADGRNDITATVVSPAGESEPSLVISYVLDTAKPKLTITSPKDGATVNKATLTIKGKTQAGSTIVARNEATGTAASAEADDDGTFSVKVPLSAGVNGIAVTATDPAGNPQTRVVEVRRGSGKLGVALAASASRISVARLPRSVELRATVRDPEGRPLRGETVTFTLSVPGVPAITGQGVTQAGGTARFTTTIPAGATRGTGLATASVVTREHGEASDTVPITLVK